METQEDIVVVFGLNHPLPLSTDWTDALVEKKNKKRLESDMTHAYRSKLRFCEQ